MNKLILPTIALGAVFMTVITTNLSAEGKHEGGHGHDEGQTMGAHWASPKEAAARVNPIKSDQASLDRGKQAFMTNCTSCHGATAKGDGPVGANMNPKPTNLTIMAGNHPDGDFEWKIANGRGAMPAWKTVLNENQRWDVVNYIQALENPNGKGNMAGMDHSNMSKGDMAEMDHSNMSKSEMEAMMAHSHSDEKVDHHKAEIEKETSENAHSKKKHTH